MIQYQTLTEMLDHRAAGAGAIGYLEGEGAEKTLPLSALRQRALGILHHLQRIGAQPGDMLILHVASNEQFIDAYWACLYGGIVPVPVAVGISDEHKQKLLRIAKQLGNPLLYTDRKLRERLATFAATQGEPEAWAALKPRTFLIDRLLKGKSTTKSWASLSLAVMERSLDDDGAASSNESKQALAKSLEDAKAPPEIGAMAISVGIVRYEGAKEALRTKFDKISEPEARGFAAIGLGLMDDRGAIQMITEVLKKSKYQPDLLKSAAIGLGLLGDKEIVPELITMLESAAGLSSQAAISSALGFIGDARSIDPLIAMLEDKQKTDRARGFAAVALGIVADKEDLPWNAKISVNANYRANTTTLTSPDTGTGILDIL